MWNDYFQDSEKWISSRKHLSDKEGNKNPLLFRAPKPRVHWSWSNNSCISFFPFLLGSSLQAWNFWDYWTFSFFSFFFSSVFLLHKCSSALDSLGSGGPLPCSLPHFTFVQKLLFRGFPCRSSIWFVRGDSKSKYRDPFFLARIPISSSVDLKMKSEKVVSRQG